MAAAHQNNQKGEATQEERTPKEGFWPHPERERFRLGTSGTQPGKNYMNNYMKNGKEAISHHIKENTGKKKLGSSTHKIGARTPLKKTEFLQISISKLISLKMYQIH